ncbi:type IV pilus biogenesis protein PilM [Geoalkalibacter sp.]|uniref:type IV pilus biogenesis protein PilM n=1 Tax=Geoalkalibacter sp. TaxID=3041440 RepID=UPI00272E70E0|nr:pilus assembly protein PilM [Geoalkalibacter sp.]
MLRRTYLGLSLNEAHIQAVALHRQGKGVQLQAARTFGLKPGAINPALREVNLSNPQEMAESIAEVLHPLAGREDRLALSLPDQAGRVILTEIESPFKTKQEGIDILRWQLKKSLPSELSDICLDFHVLSRSDTGRMRVVTSIMERGVLDQYQDVVERAGFHALLIDFHSFNLYNYYRTRLDMGEDFVFIGLEGRVLSLEIFQGRGLVFHRVRDIAEDADLVFQELNRSLVGFQGGQAALRRSAVYLHCDWKDAGTVREALTALFDKEPQLLDPHFERLMSLAAQGAGRPGPSMVAAVGAGERLLWGAA